MKIITFNINSSNKCIEDDLKTLCSLNADIYCIQEFPEEKYYLLEELFEMYFISKCREFFITKSTRKKSLKQLNIILSKYNFQKENTISHIQMKKLPLLYKITLKANTSLIESHYVDVIINNKRVRIINLHLECFISPRFRIQQFNHIYEEATKFKDYDYILFVGDFNIFAKPIYNWMIALFVQHSLKDLFINERLEFLRETYLRELQMYFPKSSTLKKLPLSCDGVISNILNSKIQNVIKIKKNNLKTSSDHFIVEVDIIFELLY